MDISLVDGKWHLRFPYSRTLVDKVKMIPGRKWEPDQKLWIVPDCLTTRSYMKYYLGVDFPKPMAPTMCLDEDYRPRVKGFAHQARISRCVIEAVNSQRSLAVFAETGTGKTKALLDAMHSLQWDNLNVLVVCPRPLVGVWLEEYGKWSAHTSPVVIHGPNRPEPKEVFGSMARAFAITSYGTLVNDLDKYSGVSIDLVVFDEAHLLKNRTSQRHKACYKLNAATKVPMTGTPYGNEYKDLHGIMQISDPQAFGPWSVFASAFCEYGGWEDKEIVGYRNLELMMKILQHRAMVVRKEECLDLPPKIYQTIRIDMSPEQKRIYERCVAGGVGDMPVASQLAAISKLRQISSGFYYDEVHDSTVFKSFKYDTLENMCWDTPTVIWYNFDAEGSKIAELFLKMGIRYQWAKGDGQSFSASQAFERGEGQVIIAQMKTLQYGVTMNRAKRHIYFSGTFSALDRAQSEDRSHRIGQDVSVTYIDFIGSEIEEWMYHAITHKIDVRDHVMKKLRELENIV